MSEMFYEENNNNVRRSRSGGTPKMAQWLMDKGIVSSESGASMILLGVAVIAIVLTIIVVKGDDIKRSFKSTPVQIEQKQSDFQERRAERLNQ